MGETNAMRASQSCRSFWQCSQLQMGVASAQQRQHFTLIGSGKTKLSHTVLPTLPNATGLLTCRIKRASSAACTVEAGGGGRGVSYGWDWERHPDFSFYFLASSRPDLAYSWRTIALAGLAWPGRIATMNGRHFQFRSSFSCCLIVGFSHFPMASCCSCTIYICSQSERLPRLAASAVLF